MKGIAMRNRYPNRQRAAAFAGILAVALAMAAGAGSAFAQDAGDDDEALDTKLFRRFMKELGFKRSEEGIEYRERAPLVVPPSRALPPPQSEGTTARNPAWPKDPDVARRKEATAAEKAKLRSTADNAAEDARPLRPDELNKGQGQAAPATASQGTPGPSAEEAARPLGPAQLGGSRTTKDFFDSMFSSFGPAKPESAPFTGEPPRTSMTAPPAGYQTPSPSQPYGIAVPTATPKASTLEQRLEAPK
jgi:hypothetical protein